MRLISCYIEGYGKIKRREYRFADGITSFCEENGEGKTTLASFIKAMFYGLKGYRKGGTEFCDREHFYPFDGGLFGGNLTFEKGGKVYKIERFFGEKSETADSIKVFCEGEEREDLREDIGKFAFDMDRESFERTAFLDSGEIEIAPTSNVRAKLNGFLVGGETDDDLDGALKALEKAAKEYKKSRAGADKVTAINERIGKLNEDVENASARKRALEGKYARARLLTEEIEELNRQIVAAQEENEKRSQLEHYDSLSKRIAEKDESVQALAKKYPLGIPSTEETESVNSYLVRGKELQTRLESSLFSLSDEEKLTKLSRRFQGELPSEETLSSVEGDIKEWTETQAEITWEKNRTSSNRERELEDTFSRSKPTKEQMELGRAKIEEYKRRKEEYAQAISTPAQTGTPVKRSTKKYGIFGGIFAALAVVGGVLLALEITLGGLLLGLGLVGLLADGFLYLNQKSGGQVSIEGENPAKKSLENHIREIEDAVKAICLPYGYYSGNGTVYDFSALERDLEEYEGAQAERAAQSERLQKKKEKIDAVATDLTAFFAEYGLEGGYSKCLSDLRSYRKEYLDLSDRKKAQDKAREELEEQILRNRVKIEEYQRKYGLEKILVNEILQDARDWLRLNKEIAALRTNASAYKTEKGLEIGVAFEKRDLASLQGNLREKQAEFSKLDREIGEDEREVEKLDGYESEKTEAEGLLKEYKRKHRLLTSTADLLRQAEGRLRDKYVRPIKEEFLYYADLLERTLGEKVVMTKDFELRFERNGKDRSEKHLSGGQRTICALCFRLALIRRMYRGQFPFLIMDDPFTSLDGGHMEKVRSLLKELSKDMQMVYFTCHESRKL